MVGALRVHPYRHCADYPPQKDQTTRSAKTEAKKAIQDAVQGKGLPFEDPLRSENGSYRLAVLGHVI